MQPRSMYLTQRNRNVGITAYREIQTTLEWTMCYFLADLHYIRLLLADNLYSTTQLHTHSYESVVATFLDNTKT